MGKTTLITIDDDPHVCEIISLYAEKAGYEVVSAHDGISGLELYYDKTPDLVVLDLMLPEMEGWSVCKAIRKAGKTPVIMLTGKSESYDKVRGLELGADDYVVKPFDPLELMARIRAVLRRTASVKQNEDVVQVGQLIIDMKEYLVKFEGETMLLPPKEMELLHYFATHPNQVFTRGQLLDKVWGYDYGGDPRTVDVHIKRIREKLRFYEPFWMIRTIRGIGYKLEGSLA